MSSAFGSFEMVYSGDGGAGDEEHSGDKDTIAFCSGASRTGGLVGDDMAMVTALPGQWGYTHMSPSWVSGVDDGRQLTIPVVGLAPKYDKQTTEACFNQ